jgi:hypothetical protein
MGAVFFTFLGGTPFIATTLFGMTGTQYGISRSCRSVSSSATSCGGWPPRHRPDDRASNAIKFAGFLSILLLGSGWESPFALSHRCIDRLCQQHFDHQRHGGAVSVRPALAGAAAESPAAQIGFGAVAMWSSAIS